MGHKEDREEAFDEAAYSARFGVRFRGTDNDIRKELANEPSDFELIFAGEGTFDIEFDDGDPLDAKAIDDANSDTK